MDFKTKLLERLQDYGVVLKEDGSKSFTVQGIGNKRTATIHLPSDLTPENTDDKVEQEINRLKQGM